MNRLVTRNAQESFLHALIKSLHSACDINRMISKDQNTQSLKLQLVPYFLALSILINELMFSKDKTI